MDSKEVEEHSLVKNKHRTLNGSQKRTLLGGPKEKEARQVCREVMKAFSGNLLRPLESVPASREHVVPTKWQVRTVLGDCISKAKAVSIRAPQYRQYTLTIDFLDFANFDHTRGSSIGHELDQGPTRRVEASELGNGHHYRPGGAQSTENTTADVQ